MLQLALIGLLAGATGGLLGIGGAVVIIPALVLLRGPEHQHLYQAAAAIVTCCVTIPAALQHQRAGAVIPRVIHWTLPTAGIGALVGTLCSELAVFRGSGQGRLQLIFAAFLAYTLLYNLSRLADARRRPPIDLAEAGRFNRAVLLFGVGLPAGLFGGLLGVGGGVITVPAQQFLLRMPLRQAIANSAVTILASTAVGALAKNSMIARHGYTLSEVWLLAAPLIPTAIVASWYTSARVHRWPVRGIRAAFAVLLVYCIYLLVNAGVGQLNAG